jgi:hypothetical protein
MVPANGLREFFVSRAVSTEWLSWSIRLMGLFGAGKSNPSDANRVSEARRWNARC